MDPTTTEAQIQELESVRKQINAWRGGVALILFGTVAVCLGVLYSDAKALAQQGPAQQRFVARFQQGLNENVVPRLKEVANQQVSEMQPIVQTEFLKLNDRVPDLTRASLQQIDVLQKELPDRGAKALDQTFTAALQAQEPEIRKMFPDVTDEQVKGLFNTLATAAQERGTSVANELLTPHVAAMNAIHANLQKIEASDSGAAAQKGDDWAMGLAVFDVVKDDVKDLTIADQKAAKLVAKAAGQVADTAKGIQAKANGMAEVKK